MDNGFFFRDFYYLCNRISNSCQEFYVRTAKSGGCRPPPLLCYKADRIMSLALSTADVSSEAR